MTTSNDRSYLRTLNAEREQAIATAEKLTGEARTDWDIPVHDEAGRMESVEDPSLVMALDIIAGHGFLDDQCGTVEHMGWAGRYGRFILRNDTQGFVDVEVTEGEGDAVSRMENLASELDSPEEDDS